MSSSKLNALEMKASFNEDTCNSSYGSYYMFANIKLLSKSKPCSLTLIFSQDKTHYES